MKTLIAISYVLFLAQVASAKIIYWDLPSSGSWHNTQNWDCKCLPTDQDTVRIGNDTVRIIGSNIGLAKKVEILDGPTAAPTGLVIFQNASLSITTNLNEALYVERGAAFANFGTLHIENSSMPIHNKGGIFENYGLISIESCTGPIVHSLSALSQHSDFLNQPSGQIKLLHSSGNAGIQSSSNFYNHGLIQIDSSTAINDISNQYRMHNEAGGRILVSHSYRPLSSTTIGVISNDSIFNNYGRIQMEDCENGIFNPNRFDNYDTISITTGITDGGYAISNQFSFDNEDPGVIEISNGSIVNSFIFENWSIIKIDSEIRNESLFRNEANITSLNSNFTINNMGGATFNNFGEITQILTLVNHAIFRNNVICQFAGSNFLGDRLDIRPGASFEGNPGGSLRISNCNNGVGIANQGTFSMSGSVTIDSCNTMIGIQNDGLYNSNSLSISDLNRTAIVNNNSATFSVSNPCQIERINALVQVSEPVIDNTGEFTINIDGELIIEDSPNRFSLKSDNQFTNNGLVSIKNTRGLSLQAGSDFQNASILKLIMVPSGFAISNDGEFTNKDSLIIDQSPNGISNAGSISNNSGHIDVSNISGSGNKALTNAGSVTNLASIHLHEVSSEALAFENSMIASQFANFGSLVIHDVNSLLAIRIAADMTNYSTGSFSSYNVVGDILEIDLGVTFNNQGILDLDL